MSRKKCESKRAASTVRFCGYESMTKIVLKKLQTKQLELVDRSAGFVHNKLVCFADCSLQGSSLVMCTSLECDGPER